MYLMTRVQVHFKIIADIMRFHNKRYTQAGKIAPAT